MEKNIHLWLLNAGPQTQPQLTMALSCRLQNPEEKPEEGGAHARALWAEAPSQLPASALGFGFSGTAEKMGKGR